MGQRSPFDLSGQRALVTGSSRGLGFAMAKALAASGADIVLNGRDTVALGAAAADLSESGVEVKALAFDVASEDSVAEAMDYCDREIGPIDILVNNAGTMVGGALEDYPLDRFEALLSANVVSALCVAQVVGKSMLARGRGKIINICSTRADRPLPGNGPYAATKAALVNLTRAMALEWAPRGLHVNGIAPGFFATEMNAARMADPDFQSFMSRVSPMGRWGEPDELGGAVVFLASAASSFVNGHILYVDGGHSAAV
ncbi:gluconate 5-dehydrogenase [Devosia sp. Leaf420]|uniref:glucose 1-dehydrogenase n=1 Tax=Devosia sp. Leaf420 TaxID=1736374 RepID=UPI000715FEBB|nr:glucose 1-dehydrogenase [Devosia sp. Leaf420]KQT44913.1 gluconate 5-dehydrogenase [Devosia sp. Leaf420]